MKILYLTGLFFLAALLFSSCNKQSTGPIIPSISFNSFTPISTDSAKLSINFTDGDGDIGSADGSPDVWIKYFYFNYDSNRYEGIYNANDASTHDSVYFVYTLPDLTPKGKNKSLTGTIEIIMSPWYESAYLTTPDSNKIEYKIWLYDRAGHISNIITAGPFTGI